MQLICILNFYFFPSALCCNASVPDMGAGSCLGLEENVVSLGKGGEEGPRPPGSKEDKQTVLSEGGGNMEKEEEEWVSWE
jgi:hypothetical protein